MKWLLLAVNLLLGASSGHAQTVPAVSAVAADRYCALVVRDRLFSSPASPYLDYGQAAPGAVADPEMAEMAKNIRQSRSIIDILNYLSRHHWEVISVVPVEIQLYSEGNNSQSLTGSSNIKSTPDHETRYLLRRHTP